MKKSKNLFLYSLLLLFVFGCSGSTSKQKSETEPLSSELKELLDDDNLRNSILNIMGSWYQKDKKSGDTYRFDVSLPFTEKDSMSKRMDVIFKLSVEDYVSEEIVYLITGIIDLYDTRKGLDEYGEKVEYLKLKITPQKGVTEINDKLMHIKTELKGGMKVLPGYQLKFTLFNNQFGSGFKKYSHKGVYEKYRPIEFMMDKILDENGERIEHLPRKKN